MFIPYILRDYFDFKDNLNKNYDEKKILSMWYYSIKYTNSKHEVPRSAIENWFEKLQDDIPVLFHFKFFIYLFHLLFALMIFFPKNYFYINKKVTVMGTTFPAVVILS